MAKNKFKLVSLQDFEDKARLDTCKNVIRDIEKEAIRNKPNYD